MIIDKNLENILLNGIKNKDDSAFEMLYKLAFPDLCSFAATFLKNKEIAKEIVQETFIKIWEKRESLSIDPTLKGYLFRSVNNNCINCFNVFEFKNWSNAWFVYGNRNRVIQLIY